MATKLYREGTTHCVRGITCEVRLFTSRHPLNFVGIDGWCATPEDINADDKWSGYTSDEIRELAKKANIEGWDTKRIHTLTEVLNGQST